MPARSSLINSDALGALALLAALVVAPAPAMTAPVAPGYALSLYASTPDPIGLSFGADGALFVGRDNAGSGGGNGDSVRVYRVVPGGGAFATYGRRATFDPDAVFFDVTGAYSGVAGSLIVGGRAPGPTGILSAIRPDQSVVTLWGPGATFVNPTDFAINALGQLLFVDFEFNSVWRTVGGAPVIAFAPGLNVRDISIHPTTGRIYLRNIPANGISEYSATGTLISTIATGIPGDGMALGPNGAWGGKLYVGATTRIIRVNSSTSRDTIASGFVGIADLEFGPDGALYASDFNADAIYRIAPATTSADAPSPSRALRLWTSNGAAASAPARIHFSLATDGHAAMRVVDVSGRHVATLFDAPASAGEHQATWDGHGPDGARAAPGVYWVTLATGRERASLKLVRVY